MVPKVGPGRTIGLSDTAIGGVFGGTTDQPADTTTTTEKKTAAATGDPCPCREVTSKVTKTLPVVVEETRIVCDTPTSRTSRIICDETQALIGGSNAATGGSALSDCTNPGMSGIGRSFKRGFKRVFGLNDAVAGAGGLPSLPISGSINYGTTPEQEAAQKETLNLKTWQVGLIGLVLVGTGVLAGRALKK